MSIQWSKNSLSNNGFGRIELVHAKNEIRSPAYTIHQINLKIDKKKKTLDISCGTIVVLEENIGSKISDTSCSKIFAAVSPRAREAKKKK